jgi:Flp pilus assembly pilin Flp
MTVMMERLRVALLLWRMDRSGATAIEYALIAVFISILCVAWATFVGTSISNFFMSAGTNL